MTKLFKTLSLGSVFILGLANCSKFSSSSSSDAAARRSALSTPLLSGDDDGRQGSSPQPTDPSNPGNPTDPGRSTPIPDPAKRTPIPVATACSQDDVARVGGSVLGSPVLNAEVINPGGTSVCTISDPSLRSTLINDRKVDLARIAEQCPTLPDGKYTVLLKAGSSGNLLLDAKDEYLQNIPMANSPIFRAAVIGPSPTQNQITAYNAIFLFYYSASAPLHIDISRNSANAMNIVSDNGTKGAVLMDTNPGYQTYTNATCDLAGSPLIVQLGNKGTQPIELSAPLSGINFNILGANSFPQANTKKLISWFTQKTAAGNYFIVLPDRSGNVTGVDQMFGDNTRGPDGKFAPTGYEALAKWDGDLDGFITESDAVFKDLRFWSDINGDGIADRSELKTLKQLNVESIDLSYDPDYLEKDRYGNEIRYKSVTKTRDGVNHVTYDIWFRILPTYARVR